MTCEKMHSMDEREITIEDLEAAFLDPEDESFGDMLARARLEGEPPRTDADKRRALAAERERIEYAGRLHFADPDKRAVYVRQALHKSTRLIFGREHGARTRVANIVAQKFSRARTRERADGPSRRVRAPDDGSDGPPRLGSRSRCRDRRRS